MLVDQHKSVLLVKLNGTPASKTHLATYAGEQLLYNMLVFPTGSILLSSALKQNESI